MPLTSRAPAIPVGKMRGKGKTGAIKRKKAAPKKRRSGKRKMTAKQAKYFGKRRKTKRRRG